MFNLNLLLVVLLFIFASCDDFTGKGIEDKKEVKNDDQKVLNSLAVAQGLTSINEPPLTIGKIILNNGINIVWPHTQKFKKDIIALNDRVKTYCSVIDNLDSETVLDLQYITPLLEGIKMKWKKAMDSYHILEGNRWGTILERGEELALSFNYYPNPNLCGVVQQVIFKVNRDNYKFEEVDFNVKGLTALEAIFYAQSMKDICIADGVKPRSGIIKRISRWEEKTPKLTQQKSICKFAKLVSQKLEDDSLKLEESWDIRKGDYTKKLLSGATNASEALNKLSDSFFTLETFTRDSRIGLVTGKIPAVHDPAGQLLEECKKAPCPLVAEHQFSGNSIEAVILNLKSFKRSFNGIIVGSDKDGFGLDDFLNKKGYESVTKGINNAFDNAIKQFEGHLGKRTIKEMAEGLDVEKCKVSTSENRAEELCALFSDLKVITTLFKNDFLAALTEVRAPRTAEGDMD